MKHKNLYIGISMIILMLLSGCQENEVLFKHYYQKSLEAYQSKDDSQARMWLEKAAQQKKELAPVVKNQSAIMAYDQGSYDRAIRLWTDLTKQQCDSVGAFCGMYWYNLGNSLYRRGEQDEEGGKKKDWEESVMAFEESLAHDASDQQAIQNRDFVQEKIDELDGDGEGEGDPSEDKKESGEGEQENDNQDNSDPSKDPNNKKDQPQDQKDDSNSSQDNKENKDKEDPKENDPKEDQDKNDSSSLNDKNQENKDQPKDDESSNSDKNKSSSDPNSKSDPEKEDSKNNQDQEQKDDPAEKEKPQDTSEKPSDLKTDTSGKDKTQQEQALEDYQSKLEQEQEQLGGFFHRNPKAKESQPDAFGFDLLNDPFFGDFFGDNSLFKNFFGDVGKLDDLSDRNVQKDW